MRILAPALLTAVAVATPALAQDQPAPFTGVHVEAITGVDRVRGGGNHETGLAYGLAGGYDLQTSGGALFGIEGEVADSTARNCDDNVLVSGDRACARADRNLYVGGRAGFVSGKTLIYGKVGYANARLTASYDDGTTAGTGDFRDHRDLSGVRLGAGLETNFGRFLAKAEYRYTNYADGVTGNQGLVGLGVRF